jgi:hypothetical protein
MVEYQPRKHQALSSKHTHTQKSLRQPGTVFLTCNPNTWEVEAGESQV